MTEAQRDVLITNFWIIRTGVLYLILSFVTFGVAKLTPIPLLEAPYIYVNILLMVGLSVFFGLFWEYSSQRYEIERKEGVSND